jgi:hypothetical protein
MYFYMVSSLSCQLQAVSESETFCGELETLDLPCLGCSLAWLATLSSGGIHYIYLNNLNWRLALQSIEPGWMHAMPTCGMTNYAIQSTHSTV